LRRDAGLLLAEQSSAVGKPLMPLTNLRTRTVLAVFNAAKNIGRLRQFGYERRGIHGEVYLWGNVVEHTLGWRAQFAYPKNLVLPLDLLPFKLAELNARLDALIAFGTDIFVLSNSEAIRVWKHGTGYDANGLDYIIGLRGRHYIQRQQERTLKKGDRVAVLGRGIAVVEQADDKEAVIVLWNRQVVRIACRDIFLNQQNMRWESKATNACPYQHRSCGRCS
jgi:hypothetical protein